MYVLRACLSCISQHVHMFLHGEEHMYATDPSVNGPEYRFRTRLVSASNSKIWLVETWSGVSRDGRMSQGPVGHIAVKQLVSGFDLTCRTLHKEGSTEERGLGYL